MLEKDLNSIINRSLSEYGFSHKIADPMHGTGTQKPFDGFSVFLNSSWYWESKFLKGYQAFNFKRIESHQMDSLLYIKKELDKVYSLIILGVYYPRKYFDLYFFDIDYIYNLIDSKKSILKKELLDLKNNHSIKIIRKDDKYWIEDVLSIPSKVLY